LECVLACQQQPADAHARKGQCHGLAGGDMDFLAERRCGRVRRLDAQGNRALFVERQHPRRFIADLD
jgi:hypothetical protein